MGTCYKSIWFFNVCLGDKINLSVVPVILTKVLLQCTTNESAYRATVPPIPSAAPFSCPSYRNVQLPTLKSRYKKYAASIERYSLYIYTAWPSLVSILGLMSLPCARTRIRWIPRRGTYYSWDAWWQISRYFKKRNMSPCLLH